MTIKSLTITEDAYKALKSMKYEEESFSDVILRISHNKRAHIERFFGIMKDVDAADWEKRAREYRRQFDRGIKNRQSTLRNIRHGRS